MTREVIGAGAGAARPARPSASTAAGAPSLDPSVPPERAAGPPVTRVRAAAMAAAAVCVGGLLGWSAGYAQTADGAAQRERGRAVLQVSARVGSVVGGATEQRLARVVVTVQNAGPSSATVQSLQAWGGGVTGVRPAWGPTRVEAGSVGELYAGVEVDCLLATGFTRAQLTASTPDGTEHVVDTAFDVPSVAAVSCGRDRPGGAALGSSVQGTGTPDGPAMAVVLTPRFGWKPQLHDVRVEGISLLASAGRPGTSEPVLLAPTGATVVLHAPDSCPPRWRTSALPTQVQLQVSEEEPRPPRGRGAAADEAPDRTWEVPVALGPGLAAWLAEHSCGAAP